MDNNPDYAVVKVTNSSGYDAQRGAHRTKQVHFRHSDGTLDYIEVPLDQYMPENVQAMVEHAVNIHKQVKSLTPGMNVSGMSQGYNPF